MENVEISQGPSRPSVPRVFRQICLASLVVACRIGDNTGATTQREKFLHVYNWAKLARILAIAASATAVASAGLCLLRDARNLVQDFGPAEGSLRVNINGATQDELESVPGIGPTRAAPIIAGRQWSSVDEASRRLPGERGTPTSG